MEPGQSPLTGGHAGGGHSPQPCHGQTGTSSREAGSQLGTVRETPGRSQRLVFCMDPTGGKDLSPLDLSNNRLS